MKRFISFFTAIVMIVCGVLPAYAEDPIIYRLRLIAQDQFGNPIPNITMYLEDESNYELQQFLNYDENGVCEIDLWPSSFRISQTGLPVSFLPSQEIVYVTVEGSPVAQEFVITYNKKVGESWLLCRTGGDQGVAYTEVDLYKSDGTFISSHTTDHNGNLTVPNLEYGDYKYSLVYCHSPYFYTGNDVPFSIRNNGETVMSTMYFDIETIEDYRVELTCTDGVNPVSGAVFGVYSGITKLYQITTGADGRAVTYLVAGNYEMRQISAPVGYEVQSAHIPFSVTAYGDTVELNTVNPKIAARVEVTCTDGTNPIETAVVAIHRADDLDNAIEELVSLSDGKALSSVLPYGDYKIVLVSAPNPYVYNGAPVDFSITANGVTVAASILLEDSTAPEINGTVRVFSTDGTNPVAGAVFGVYQSDSLLHELTTESDGYAQSPELPEGSYELRQISAPEGYVAHGANIPFTIATNGEIVDVTANNPQITGTVKVTSTDGTNPIEGSVIGLYRSDNLVDAIEELVTDADGIAESGNLTYGDYRLVVQSNPAPYEYTGDPVDFSITENGVAIEIGIVSEEATVPEPEINGTVRVYSTDGTNPVDGAVFGVYQSDALLHELTTEADGYAQSPALPAGNYELRQHTAPEGYVAQSANVPFVIANDGETVAITISNPQIAGTVKVTSTDGTNPIEGTVVSLYRSEDLVNVVEELVTDADGIAESGSITYGDYRLVVQSNPAPYEYTGDPVDFSITENGVAVEIGLVSEETTAPEPPINGSVRVFCSDGTNPVVGAVFGVYQSDALLHELTTEADGYAQSPALPEGGYEIRQISAPDGFVIQLAPTSFSIANDGETVAITVSNPQITGTVKVTSTDGTNPIEGTVVSLYRSEDLENEVEELVTDADGIAESGSITYGEYRLVVQSNPAPYEYTGAPVDFAITENGVAVEIGLVSEDTTGTEPEPAVSGTVRVFSTDGTNPVVGAVFGVYQADTKLYELTTGDYGYAQSFALSGGSYELRQISTPEGYVIQDTHIPFSIAVNGEIVDVTIVNPLITGTVKVTSTDGTNPIEGTVIALYRSNDLDNEVEELVTDADGIAESGSLTYGEYRLVVLSNPNPYVYGGDPVDFEIAVDGATVSIDFVSEDTTDNETDPDPDPDPDDNTGTPNVTNKPNNKGPEDDSSYSDEGWVVLTVRDDNTREKVAGAVYGVYTSKGVEVKRQTSRHNGLITFVLPAGRYYIQAVSSPTGYRLNEDKIWFTLAANQTVEFTTTTQKLPVVVENNTQDASHGKYKPGSNYHDNPYTGAMLPGESFSVQAEQSIEPIMLDDDVKAEESSGSFGSVWIYASGICVGGVIFFFLTRKRNKNEE